MSVAWIVAMVLALVCLAYVLYPLVSGGGLGGTRRGSPEPPGVRATVTDEEIEAAIKAYRDAHVVGQECAACGRRPESDAVFCSNCGRRLVGGPDHA